MLACVRTVAVDGLDARPVSVEVDVRPGLPAFTVVGLGDVAVREARERVHAAILNSGFEFPGRRITANLAPAHLPKLGPGFDLAMACGVLAASGQVPTLLLGRLTLFGELSLGGGVRACAGTLAVAQATARCGLGGLVLARDAAREAALVSGLDVVAVGDLREAAGVLRGERAAVGAIADLTVAVPEPDLRPAGDLSELRGQDAAVAAAVVAAAGGHNLLMSGPPGVGKTMLAWRLPTILPPLTMTEAVEVTRIHSLAAGAPPGRLVRERPFRAPHHSITPAGLVGGSNPRVLGEAVLAHRGVLFLDELSEFTRATLEGLRQPLEDGRVAIVRASHTVVHPARFMLLAATNPCPCGLGVDDTRCACSDVDLARHRRRLSNALLDRMDVLVELERPTRTALAGPGGLTSARAGEAVGRARERQAARGGSDGSLNALMDQARLREDARLDHRGDRVLASAFEQGMLSARAHTRVLRVARTVADLAGSDRIAAEHVLRALSMRRDPGLARVPLTGAPGERMRTGFSAEWAGTRG